MSKQKLKVTGQCPFAVFAFFAAALAAGTAAWSGTTPPPRALWMGHTAARPESAARFLKMGTRRRLGARDHALASPL